MLENKGKGVILFIFNFLAILYLAFDLLKVAGAVPIF